MPLFHRCGIFPRAKKETVPSASDTVHTVPAERRRCRFGNSSVGRIGQAAWIPEESEAFASFHPAIRQRFSGSGDDNKALADRVGNTLPIQRRGQTFAHPSQWAFSWKTGCCPGRQRPVPRFAALQANRHATLPACRVAPASAVERSSSIRGKRADRRGFRRFRPARYVFRGMVPAAP